MVRTSCKIQKNFFLYDQIIKLQRIILIDDKKISPKSIYIFLIKLKNLLIRKDQKYFFQIEKFSKLIKVANRNFILLNNYIFEFNNFIKKKINLKILKN